MCHIFVVVVFELSLRVVYEGARARMWRVSVALARCLRAATLLISADYNTETAGFTVFRNCLRLLYTLEKDVAF